MCPRDSGGLRSHGHQHHHFPQGHSRRTTQETLYKFLFLVGGDLHQKLAPHHRLSLLGQPVEFAVYR
jgi:hypothetical protein